MESIQKMEQINPEFTEKALAWLEELQENPALLSGLSSEQKKRLFLAAGSLSRPDGAEQARRRKEKRQYLKMRLRQVDRTARSQVGIRQARLASVFQAPPRLAASTQTAPGRTASPRNCYICKKEFTQLHFFYDALYPDCAPFNYEKRYQKADLTGQVALLTGGRVKIGYQAALCLLRSGARVMVTTRFPVDATGRFSAEADFPAWADRLQIYGLDLRHTPSVESFCSYLLSHLDRLDLLINNAAQTARRPVKYYQHLMAAEEHFQSELSPARSALLTTYRECQQLLHTAREPTGPDVIASNIWSQNAAGLMAPAVLSRLPFTREDRTLSSDYFPADSFDADLQQVDLRTTNSWRLRLGEIETAEMLEIQLINAIAPFILCNKLAPLMKRDGTGKKHIVNVTAMEGKFYRFRKADRHPHTNMAKAALNMLTHTAASGLARDGIYMNAVDTGWVTDEDPVDLARHKQEVHDFQPPLDIVDGAARILDPYLQGMNGGELIWGKFLKDYRPIDW